MSTYKILRRLLLAVIIIGVLGAVAFSFYRLGTARGALNAPFESRQRGDFDRLRPFDQEFGMRPGRSVNPWVVIIPGALIALGILMGTLFAGIFLGRNLFQRASAPEGSAPPPAPPDDVGMAAAASVEETPV